MAPRFGFHNASAIDSLLDKEDIAVEAILDEDDLLQECKAQNTRLIDYFQRVGVLQRLLGYVTGQIEGEERGQFKYPYVATEVLCSEIWSIVETCVNSQVVLLVPFWDAVLERTPEDMKTQMVMASHFAKINAVFLSKRPSEMLAFIRAQPYVVERLLRHIETPSFVDLLVRIIQLDEQPGGSGVLEWLSSEKLIPRLLALLSPTQPSDVHTVVAELIKGIVSMATPAPGPALELQSGPASNLFARQLASADSINTLVGYILGDFPQVKDGDGDSDSETLPNRASCTSSVVHSIAIIIELIRKNNSNYFEPYLFHTLRNRLIQVQQQMMHSSPLEEDGGRETLEKALREMVERMGVVHLGSALDILSGRLDILQGYLRTPRSFNGPMQTTVGEITPLTFERYRICELFAELLHCSNMALLNRSVEFDQLYDSEGRLQGGLAALEELARVIALNSGDERDRDASMRLSQDDITPAHELPVTGSARSASIIVDSDEDMSDDPGSSDDDSVTMEELNMYEDPTLPISAPQPSPPFKRAASEPPPSPPLQEPPHLVPSSPGASVSPPSPTSLKSPDPAMSTSTSTGSLRSHSSKRNSRRSIVQQPDTPLPIGDQFKRRFIDLNIASTLLDLFFEFPWNNFLHSSVYDLIHQILTGTVDSGLGRELALSLFRDARLMHRIVEGQRTNDALCARPKGVRLGFMGHLTLIAEDVLTALDRFPAELKTAIATYAPQPDWDEYVQGRYNETKRLEAELLGGGKPVVRSGAAGGSGGPRWKVDEEDTGSALGESVSASAGVSAASMNTNVRGEFKRATSARPTREGSADFGPAPMDEMDDEMDRARRFEYMTSDISASDHFDSDDEEDGGGWLSQSTFSLRKPPVSSRHIQGSERRPLGVGFDDAFNPSDDDGPSSSHDPFGSPDDDGFGPFSDAAASDGSDPFFTSSFSDEMEDSAFDSFADFPEFGSPPKDGELTPTAGSWTFTSDSLSDDAGSEHSIEPLSPEEEKRMP
ncbi:SIT4 phosphatase-associated protein-domain-containing protein [Mycena pura]|uniref:SIT4 phosphatase-associated protein-domain-containing protein n=1 Tax=Mycena pura TaxID=153505 RepID=A0AAD6UW37_9AGAR|nr:SIT4 phosphatase-associated protein-domain-containing protein [Mycena pura]